MNKASYALEDLVRLMQQLRHPEQGCPWDLKQTFDTIVPHTLEEAYEVAEAIAQKDWDELKKELGDLIFQVMFYSQLADEKGWFDIHQVIDGLVHKMIRRHPHVFPDGTLLGNNNTKEQDLSDEALHQQWNAIKSEERSGTLGEAKIQSVSVMDNITEGLPGLIKAWKLQKKAASVGFDWDDVIGVKDQLLSELQEVEEATDPDHIEEELGDLLFCVVNLARHHKVHPETALIKANQKFERRFRAMEALAEVRGDVFDRLSLDQKEALWQEVKRLEQQ